MSNNFSQNTDINDFNIDYLRITANNVARNYYDWDTNISEIETFRHIYTSAILTYKYNGFPVQFFGNFVEIITQQSDYDHNKAYWNNAIGFAMGKYARTNKISFDKLQQLTYELINDNIAFVDDNMDDKFYNGQSFEELYDYFDEKLYKSGHKTPFNIYKEILKYLYLSRDTDMPEDMINDLYNQYNGYRGKFRSAGDCECTPKDPIIFDLNNDGVLETTDINNGIYFDHENDGFAESSAWVGDNDGVLVTDSNNNGEIDNGSELLTAETLASFDTNEDGIIDENDTNFANLKILKSDGTLMTLTEAGITSINLNTTSTEITDKNGNQQFASGTFTRADGTTGTFGEFLVKTETSNSIATEWLDETDEISDLPDISGSGNIYSLHQAMRHVA